MKKEKILDHHLLAWSLVTLHIFKNYLKMSNAQATFQKVNIACFLGYYYKNDLQDKVVSVPAMLKMFEQLGTHQDDKTTGVSKYWRSCYFDLLNSLLEGYEESGK